MTKGTAKVTSNTSPIDLELKLRANGNYYIIGIDEAGRGALAGDLAIGYCVLPLYQSPEWILKTFEGVTDSKKLTEKRRKELFEVIKSNALASGSIFVSSETIDDCGLNKSNRIGVKKAVQKAISDIGEKVSTGSDLLSPNDSRVYILGDKGLLMPYDPHDFPYGMTDHVNGELKSLSIAAASIMAKVSRDATMLNVEPEDDVKWGFAKHKGYGTAAHIAAIQKYGVHPIHRKTFAPIPTILMNLRHSFALEHNKVNE